MSEDRTFDPDFTSRSHIYNALNRAGSDYGGNMLVKRRVDEMMFRSRTALGHKQYSANDYLSLLKHSRAVMNKEIKLSVRRSRRWAGKDQQSNVHGFAFPAESKLLVERRSPQMHRSSHPQLHQQQKPPGDASKRSAEVDYHQTICDILANKGGRSSYGHVAKVMTRSADSGQSETLLPGVVPVNNQPNCSTPSATNSQKSTRKHLDIILPSVYDADGSDLLLSNPSRGTGEVSPEVHRRGADSCIPLLYKEPIFPKNLNLSNLCKVLSDHSSSDQLQEEKLRLLMKKQAQRALTSCYSRHKSEGSSTKVVVVHLPNPNIGLEAIKEQKRAPRLLLRNSNLPRATPVKHYSTNQEKFFGHDDCPSPISRINIKPFLPSQQPCPKPAPS